MPKILSDVLTYGMQLFQLCQKTRTDASRVHTDNVEHTVVKEGQRRLKQVYHTSYSCTARIQLYLSEAICNISLQIAVTNTKEISECPL